MGIKTKSSRLRWLGGALAIVFLAGTSMAADGPRYTYLEAGYINLDFNDLDATSADGDGFNFAGSVAVTDMVHVFASYADGDVDVDDVSFGAISVDYNETIAGVGVNYPVSETVDLVGKLAYVGVEAEASGISVDANGYGLAGGIRAMVAPTFEMNAGLTYVDLGDDGDDGGNDTSFDLGVVLNFTKMFAATAGLSWSDDLIQYGLGLRLYIGDR